MNQTGDYLFLFADLIGSTEVAVEVAPAFYAQTYIASFHWAAQQALEYVKQTGVFPQANFTRTIEEIKIAGDEVFCFAPLDEITKRVDLQSQVASAVAFAYVTKLYWLASPYNLRRLLGKQFPRDIAVGIHIGPAAAVHHGGAKDIASLHINVTKRIETVAREGTESRIFASYDVADIFESWRRQYNHLDEHKQPPLIFASFLKRPDPVSGKGVPKKFQVLELVQAKQEKEDSSRLLELMRQLTISPEEEDIAAERAVKIMAETFLLQDGYPFRDNITNAKVINYDIESAQTATGYIDKWFEAISSQSKLFFDESWLVLNCHVLSCAMMRHTGVDLRKRKHYIEICKGNLKRLVELLGRQERK